MSMLDVYGNTTRDKRRKVGGSRKNELKNLQSKNHEILNLDSVGMKGTHIAKALGVSKVTVSNTLNSSVGKEKMRIMRGAADGTALKVQDRIQGMTEKALDVLEKILDNEDERASLSLRRNVARDVLIELGGHGAPKKLDVRSATTVITPEFLDELKQQGKRAAEECGMIVPDSGSDEPSPKFNAEPSPHVHIPENEAVSSSQQPDPDEVAANA